MVFGSKVGVLFRAVSTPLSKVCSRNASRNAGKVSVTRRIFKDGRTVNVVTKSIRNVRLGVNYAFRYLYGPIIHQNEIRELQPTPEKTRRGALFGKKDKLYPKPSIFVETGPKDLPDDAFIRSLNKIHLPPSTVRIIRPKIKASERNEVSNPKA